MSVLQQLKARKKAAKEEVTLEVPGIDEEVTFRLRAISLSEILQHADTYPSLHSLMHGAQEAGDDEPTEINRILTYIDAVNVVVALGAEIKNGKQWVSFDVNDEEKGEDALVPKEVLPQTTLVTLGTKLLKMFRL